MKIKIAAILLLSVGACMGVLRAQTTTAQDVNAPKTDTATAAEVAEILPMVQFEDAPLEDVIRTLARQANLNIIFDPRVLERGPEDKSKYPPVSIRLENVTAQNVLEAILNNNNLRLDRDLKTKITRVTIKDPAAAEPLISKVIQLKYSNPSNLVNIIKPTLTRNSQVIADGRTSQLIVLTTEKDIIPLEELIAKLDTATKQVLIEAKILETARNPATVKGVNWAGTFQAQNIAFGNNNYGRITEGGTTGDASQNPKVVPGTTPGLMAFLRAGYISPVAYLNADGAKAVFSFFNTDTETEIIATPRAVTADNTTANLSVSRAVPIFKVTQGGTQTGNSVDITYTNLGVLLEVTPRISAEDKIALTVVPEVSDIAGKDSQTMSGETFTANIFSIRRIKTQVLIPSGNTLVLGGLLSDSARKEKTKVPLLGDLPGMKNIFGSSSKSRQKGNLLIFVTPTVVVDEDYQPATTQFLKQRMPSDDSPTDLGTFDGPWDGVEPYDWGKPVY